MNPGCFIHWWRARSIGLAFLLGATMAIAVPVAAQRADPVRVWVNNTSHVYHCPGTRYYGTTKRGVWMSEADALAEGNRPAAGNRCAPGASKEKLLTPQALGDVGGAGAGVRVWVNTSSGVYHCPGSKYYGGTKRGQVMTEAMAKASGYRAAGGNACS